MLRVLVIVLLLVLVVHAQLGITYLSLLCGHRGCKGSAINTVTFEVDLRGNMTQSLVLHASAISWDDTPTCAATGQTGTFTVVQNQLCFTFAAPIKDLRQIEMKCWKGFSAVSELQPLTSFDVASYLGGCDAAPGTLVERIQGVSFNPKAVTDVTTLTRKSNLPDASQDWTLTYVSNGDAGAAVAPNHTPTYTVQLPAEYRFTESTALRQCLVDGEQPPWPVIANVSESLNSIVITTMTSPTLDRALQCGQTLRCVFGPVISPSTATNQTQATIHVFVHTFPFFIYDFDYPVVEATEVPTIIVPPSNSIFWWLVLFGLGGVVVGMVICLCIYSSACCRRKRQFSGENNNFFDPLVDGTVHYELAVVNASNCDSIKEGSTSSDPDDHSPTTPKRWLVYTVLVFVFLYYVLIVVVAVLAHRELPDAMYSCDPDDVIWFLERPTWNCTVHDVWHRGDDDSTFNSWILWKVRNELGLAPFVAFMILTGVVLYYIVRSVYPFCSCDVNEQKKRFESLRKLSFLQDALGQNKEYCVIALQFFLFMMNPITFVTVQPPGNAPAIKVTALLSLPDMILTVNVVVVMSAALLFVLAIIVSLAKAGPDFEAFLSLLTPAEDETTDKQTVSPSLLKILIALVCLPLVVILVGILTLSILLLSYHSDIDPLNTPIRRGDLFWSTIIIYVLLAYVHVVLIVGRLPELTHKRFKEETWKQIKHVFAGESEEAKKERERTEKEKKKE